MGQTLDVSTGCNSLKGQCRAAAIKAQTIIVEQSAVASCNPHASGIPLDCTAQGCSNNLCVTATPQATQWICKRSKPDDDRPHAPAFSVPPDVDVNRMLQAETVSPRLAKAEDAAQSPGNAVQIFADALTSGVTIRLAINGVDTESNRLSILDVETRLNKNLTALSVAFNDVRKTVPLASIRQVCMDKVPQAPQEVASMGKVQWYVRLELEPDGYCIFVFDGTEKGSIDGTYFGTCIKALAEAARFEAVKIDLATLGTSASDAGPRPGADEDLPSARSHPEGNEAALLERDVVAARLMLAANQLSDSDAKEDSRSGARPLSPRPSSSSSNCRAAESGCRSTVAAKLQCITEDPTTPGGMHDGSSAQQQGDIGGSI